MMRCAFSPDSERPPAPGRAGLRPSSVRRRAGRGAPPRRSPPLPSPLELSRRLAAAGVGRRRRGGRAVVELLLGAEQQVEHLRAKALAERERERAADRDQQQRAAEAAAPAAARCGALRAARRWRRAARRRRSRSSRWSLRSSSSACPAGLPLLIASVGAACRRRTPTTGSSAAPRLRSDAAGTGCSALPVLLPRPCSTCPFAAIVPPPLPKACWSSDQYTRSGDDADTSGRATRPSRREARPAPAPRGTTTRRGCAAPGGTRSAAAAAVSAGPRADGTSRTAPRARARTGG